MAPVEPIAGGVRIRLHVMPRASAPGPAGLHGDSLKLRLTSPPVDGAANEELVRLLSQLLGVPRAGIELVAGQTGRRKTVRVMGIAADEAARRLGL